MTGNRNNVEIINVTMNHDSEFKFNLNI